MTNHVDVLSRTTGYHAAAPHPPCPQAANVGEDDDLAPWLGPQHGGAKTATREIVADVESGKGGGDGSGDDDGIEASGSGLMTRNESYMPRHHKSEVGTLQVVSVVSFVFWSFSAAATVVVVGFFCYIAVSIPDFSVRSTSGSSSDRPYNIFYFNPSRALFFSVTPPFIFPPPRHKYKIGGNQDGWKYGR